MVFTYTFIYSATARNETLSSSKSLSLLPIRQDLFGSSLFDLFLNSSLILSSNTALHIIYGRTELHQALYGLHCIKTFKTKL